MAKTIGFNIRLNVDGKEVVVQCKKGIDDLSRALGTIPGKAGAIQRSFMGFAAVTTTIQGMYSGLQQIAGVMTTYIQKANAATEAQVKLRTVMMQRMQATQQDIDAINELVKSQTALGVVGGTVQRSGLQQLATFASQRSTLETLLPAMNNLLVQQNGINSTSENAVGIGPTVGIVGEYAGASQNPEVIAPLDKLRTLIEPRDTGGLSGRVVFRVKGRELEGVMERQRRFEGRT